MEWRRKSAIALAVFIFFQGMACGDGTADIPGFGNFQPSPEEWRYLEDISKHPDDDAPRLRYADWLDRRKGIDDRRGEFIRTQIALVNEGGGPRRGELKRCEQALLLAYGKNWLPSEPAELILASEFPLFPEMNPARWPIFHFSRGVVEGITVPDSGYRVGADRFRSTEEYLINRMPTIRWVRFGENEGGDNYLTPEYRYELVTAIRKLETKKGNGISFSVGGQGEFRIPPRFEPRRGTPGTELGQPLLSTQVIQISVSNTHDMLLTTTYLRERIGYFHAQLWFTDQPLIYGLYNSKGILIKKYVSSLDLGVRISEADLAKLQSGAHYFRLLSD